MRHLSMPKMSTVERLRFSPDGQLLAVAASSGVNVRVWRVASGKPACSLTSTSHPRSLGFAGPTRLIMLNGYRLQTWDVGARPTQVLREMQLVEHRPAVDVTPDGSRLLFGHIVSAEWVLVCRSTTDDAVLWQTTHRDAVFGRGYRFAFSGDGSRFVGASRNAGVFDALTGEVLRTLAPPSGAVWEELRVALSWDGRTLAIASSLSMWVMCVETGEVLATLPWAADLAFTVDGRLASANEDRVEFREPDTWREQEAFLPGIGDVRALAFSPDGMLGAVGGTQGRAVLWDVG